VNDLLRQPKAVWAVAFACVIAFMGIGLVDPILPALAQSFDATPSQVELLFTSYFAIIAVSMLVTGWISSRIGAKKTLLAGLALVVVFSAASGAAGSITEIVGFRAVWGLGNALFIATALSAIVGAASGGLGSAIILYEAALGLGIASGPLLGGELGAVSWRGPFFGTAALMAIGFVAIVVLLEKSPAPAGRQSLGAPLAALRHRGLLGLGLTALSTTSASSRCSPTRRSRCSSGSTSSATSSSAGVCCSRSRPSSSRRSSSGGSGCCRRSMSPSGSSPPTSRRWRSGPIRRQS
jgi:ACDE family multidrug resistance protein